MFSDPGKMESTTNLEHSNKSLWFCVCNCFMVLNWIKMGGHVGMYYDNLTLVHFTALYRQQATTSTDIDKYPWRQNLYDHLPYRTSPISIPWAFWQGYGSRLREQVARDHLGSRDLTIDAVEDSVPSNRKYGYTEAFTVSRWLGAVTVESLVPGPEQHGVSIVEVRWNSRVGGQCVDTLRPRQNGRHFADAIFLNENVWIPIEISLKFVPKGPIDNIPALVQIMAWRRSGGLDELKTPNTSAYYHGWYIGCCRLESVLSVPSFWATLYTKTAPSLTKNS